MRHGVAPSPPPPVSQTLETVQACEAAREEEAPREPPPPHGETEQHEHKKESPRLGCYFCNDVVAPLDSTANRSLDQQCTVTRAGLAPIAAALAVELAVGLLHHPMGYAAPADPPTPITDSTALPLGILPHQVRGFMSYFAQLVVTGLAFDKCTACSAKVVDEYRSRGEAFLLQVFNEPSFLEDLTGLTEMLRATDALNIFSDGEEDQEGDGYDIDFVEL
eukprot:TRINITY_DN4158_c0_g1_i1.p1 TRINITY_DN4158_c0_g1~~TRINITY_DN4158_c0_g1_i1.p1  ORF type:complete len:220 (-),score=52.39 TRINITY_DN4158_c0_g1_i1:500-1159(-)